VLPGGPLVAPRNVGRYLTKIAVVFAAQFAAGRLGDVVQTINSGGIGPVWPASGVALGAILLFGYSVWPGVAAGALLLASLSHLPLWAAFAYAAGTTLAALMAAFLLRHIADFRPSLSRLHDVLGLILFGALGSAIVSASIGASILYAARMRGWSGFGPAWLIYLLGDTMGVLLVTPVMLTFTDLLRIRPLSRIAEFVAGLSLLVIVCFIIFGDLPLIPVQLHILAFAVLPFVIGAAIRFGVSGAALATLLIALIATIESALGSGPFASNNNFLNAVLLDVFFGVFSTLGLTLAAVIAEREQSEREREKLVREQAATEARLHLAAIVESSDDAIISKNLDGVIVSWNAAAERIFGFSETEAVGQPITMIIPPELLDEEKKIPQTVKAGEHIEHLETIRVSKIGKKIDISLSISPLKDASGRVVGASTIARDITERKRAEEALRTSEERLRMGQWAARLGTYEWNIRTGVSIWTPELEALYGLPPGGFGGTRDAFENLVHPDDRAKVIDLIDEAIKTGQPTEGEWRVVWPDGSLHWIAARGQVFMNESGEPSRMFGVHLDVTERKRADEALSDMTRKLVEAQEQERARIARELHDDINQRLAMLAIELEQLQDDPSEVRSRVQELRKRTTEISNDVQALSHDLHSSQLEYLGVVAGMKSWCKEFGERQRMQIDCRHDVRSTLPPEIGLCLFRVLQEALHNVSKHSGVKQIEVQLREESDEIHLTVSDSGRGFDVEAVKQGKGLGLTSMQERVRLLDGMIEIQSKPMGGTTVHVRVPLRSERASQREAG
jgi:PAS domain S-box-containing protein